MNASTRISSPFILLSRWQTRQQCRPVRPICEASSLCIGLSPSIASTHGTIRTCSWCSQSHTVNPSSRSSLYTVSNYRSRVTPRTTYLRTRTISSSISRGGARLEVARKCMFVMRWAYCCGKPASVKRKLLCLFHLLDTFPDVSSQ